MSRVDDGGPAFPFTPNPQPRNPDGTWCQNWDSGESGMALRDYFAGLAMPRVCGQDAPWDLLAEQAYTMADAMIRARSKVPEVTP